jgi:hypothetical protein
VDITIDFFLKKAYNGNMEGKKMKKLVSIILTLILVLSFSSVANAQITKEQYYARSTLNGNELEYYNAVYDYLANSGSDVYRSDYGINKERSDQLWQFVYSDSPEIFNYGSYYSDDEKIQLDTELKVKSEKILANINDDMSDYEKVKAIYIYLGKNIKYDYNAFNQINNGSTYTDTQESHTIVGGLINEKAVCDGIAKSLQYLLYQLDIPCFFVGGIYGKNNHAWNIIQIDGQWYHADLTSDLQYIKNSQTLIYFLVSDDFISNDHNLTSTDGINYNPPLQECPENYKPPVTKPIATKNTQQNEPNRITLDIVAQTIKTAPTEAEPIIPTAEQDKDHYLWYGIGGVLLVALIVLATHRKKKKA